MSGRFRLALAVGAVAFAADRATKLWGMDYFGLAGGHWTSMPARASVMVNDYFNLVVVWNRGVSFGLFASDSDATQWLLTTFAVVVTGWLMWWTRQEPGVILGVGAGLISGGAIGNAWDRIAHGAVFDFLDFHALGLHWYAFNIADAAISVGAAALVLHFVFEDRSARSGRENRSDMTGDV